MKAALVIAAAAANCALAVTLRGTGSSANHLVAWGTGSDSEHLEADGSLRPEVVAQLLGQVGMSWVHDRYEAMEHSISDALALAHITQSCSKVASAVVTGAKGDRHRVKEYMGFVCEKSHHKPLCQNFTTDIYAFMNGDLMYNRQELNYTSFCAHLYNSTLVGAAKDEKVRLEKAWEEHLKADEADKKRREEENLAEEKKRQAIQEWRKAERERAEQEKLAMQALKEAEAAKADAEEKAAIADLANKSVKSAAKSATQNATSKNVTAVLAKAEEAVEAAKAPEATANATAAANATAPDATSATAVKNATNATNATNAAKVAAVAM